MAKVKTAREARIRRHRRIRKRIQGTPERPRLAVFRSLHHIYAQVIADTRGLTLVAAAALEPARRGQRAGQTKVVLAARVGETLARRALEKGITRVVFARGGFKYHGRVKALAEAARQAGLQF